SRARTLLDLLEEPAADLDRGIAPELRERLRAARRRLNAKARRQLQVLGRQADAAVAAAVESEVHEALTELETVGAEIRRASPRFAALSAAETLDAGEIRSLLDPETVLLEIALGEERSFLFKVTADAVASFELPGRESIEALARQAHQQLTQLDLRTRRTPREAAHELTRLVLGPVAPHLAGRRLVVVPDGALHYVPFATLPLPVAGGEGEVPLLERWEVVHLPSASALALQRRLLAAREPAPKTAAVLADPVFDALDPRLGSPPRHETPSSAEDRFQAPGKPGITGFDRLPLTREEALAIAALAPQGQVLTLLGFDASRDTVLSAELDDYRILHFATHGLVDPRSPELSGLMLSQVDADGRSRDGFLRLHDLLGLELGADLVVLSGCRTALGKEVRGEGFVGLARGFLYAGVPRVVASLWQVQDQATAELMARFYRGLLEDGKPAAAAMREAQLAVREKRRWRDPFFWGAFLFQGEWR
ncbi:MAG: CHAT domain-containing protein, partial [bacterium]|nr:CHAT domain-containing protein [bacterium]